MRQGQNAVGSLLLSTGLTPSHNRAVILLFCMMFKGDVRNFSNNAAEDTKRQATGSKVGVVKTSTSELNRNWNAGDTEAVESVGPDGEGADGETSRRVSDAGRKVSIAVPAGAAGDKDNDTESVSEVGENRLSLANDNIAKLRRFSALHGDDSETSKLETKRKRKVSKLRLCVRRCIAEDKTWDLKTVPDLDMLVVRYFADNYAGTFNRFEGIGLYTFSCPMHWTLIILKKFAIKYLQILICYGNVCNRIGIIGL